MFVLLFASCLLSILPLYQQEREQVMIPATGVPEAWEPEIRFRMSSAQLNELAGLSIEETLTGPATNLEFEGPLGLEAGLRPTATVEELKLKASKDCEGCLDLTVQVKGKAKWHIGPVSGTVPFDAFGHTVLAFEVEPAGDSWRIRARIKDVKSVRLGNVLAGKVNVTKLLKSWTEEHFHRTTGIPLGVIGGPDLPLRAVRIGSSSGAIEIQALTNLSTGTPVPEATTPLDDGWELRISQDSFVGLLRRRALSEEPLVIEEPVRQEIVADPRHILVEDGSFTLDLRLWGLSGRGWWRDYRVTGEVEVRNRKIQFTPSDAEAGKHSRGAAVINAVALWQEKHILQGIESTVRTAIPASSGIPVGGRKLVAQATEVLGKEGALIVQGTLESKAPRQDKATDKGNKNTQEKKKDEKKARTKNEPEAQESTGSRGGGGGSRKNL